MRPLIAAISTGRCNTRACLGENLVSVMRRTKLLSQIEGYYTKIPLYPGADFGFFLYSHDGVSLRQSVQPYEGRRYSADVHQAAFVLPAWQCK